eukprot:CAMPEP_0175028598 /NCGR_PEP_ID=MMETSP0005-20121125/19098_1 /TAXON_ID=420556 /ORGANISM="Ochromonas sp., Strain CCMP1393" /LENGTH=84 /DNA_ID=CAMNT_0016288253 /DNA_START=100 /DNA_END=351 /DNA_ORIENTATION=+
MDYTALTQKETAPRRAELTTSGSVPTTTTAAGTTSASPAPAAAAAAVMHSPNRGLGSRTNRVAPSPGNNNDPSIDDNSNGNSDN